MDLTASMTLGFLLAQFLTVGSQQFTASPGATETACVGSDKLLKWQFSDTSSIYAVVWSKAGTPILLLDSYGNVKYIEASVTESKVTYEGNGKIKILSIVQGDEATYAIHVWHSAVSGLSTLHSSTSLTLLDPPPQPILNITTNSFACELGGTGTPAVTLKTQVNGVEQASAVVTRTDDVYFVECCLEGDAVQCMTGVSSTSNCWLLYNAVHVATGVTLTEPSSTCDSSSTYTCVTDNCVYPTDSTSSAFQWSYTSGGTETQISSSDVIITRTLLTDSCTGNERKIQSELTGITGISAVSSSSVIFKCTFKQPGLTDRSATASSSCTIASHYTRSAFG